MTAETTEPKRCASCGVIGIAHAHLDLGIEKVPKSAYFRHKDQAQYVSCSQCWITFDTSQGLDRLTEHLRAHYPLPSKRKKEELKEIPKKARKATPPGKEGTKQTKEPAKEKATRKSKNRVYENRVYEKRKNKNGYPAVWLHYPKADRPKLEKLEMTLAKFTREAWTSRPENPPQVVPEKPLAATLVYFPQAEADEIVAFEKAGGDFDAYINSRIQRKIAG